MEKLSKEDILDYVHKIRIGERNDYEVANWIQRISESIPNPEVINTIMVGQGITDEEVVERLYSYKSIIL